MKQRLPALSILFLLLFAQVVYVQQDTIIAQADTASKVNVIVGPQFPGGITGLNQFLAKNLKYPIVARENDIQGKVYVSLIIEKDGSISSYTITKTDHETLNEGALKLMKKMPAYIPGTKNGVPARFKIDFPLTFSLR